MLKTRFANRWLSGLLLAGCLAAAPACASSAPSAPPPDSNRMQPGHAPTPFNAKQLRDACPPGRVDVFLIESSSRPPARQVTRFLNRTPTGAVFESSMLTAEGQPLGATVRARATWEDLQEHASFPAASTVMTEDDVRVPAGSFDCWVYSVTTGSDVQRLYFAKNLPGPPVRAGPGGRRRGPDGHEARRAQSGRRMSGRRMSRHLTASCVALAALLALGGCETPKGVRSADGAPLGPPDQLGLRASAVHDRAVAAGLPAGPLCPPTTCPSRVAPRTTRSLAIWSPTRPSRRSSCNDSRNPARRAATRCGAHTTWKDMRDRGWYPDEWTQITAERVRDVGGGRSTAASNAVTSHGGKVDRYHFANDLPGPPVLHTRHVDGALQLTMTLVAHTPAP